MDQHLQKIFRRANKRFAQLTGRETVDIRLSTLSGREVNAAKSPDVVNSLGLDIDGPDFGCKCSIGLYFCSRFTFYS